MATTFHFIKTAKQDELAIQMDIPEKDFTPDLMPSLGAQMDDCAAVRSHRISDGWKSYVFSAYNTSSPGFVSLIFTKKKTLEEMLVPYVSWISYQDHQWPAILKDLYFNDDREITHKTENKKGTVYVPVWYARKSYIPATQYNSKVLCEKFLGNYLPFPPEVMRHTQPVPTEVEWDFANTRGSIICLHGPITIKSRGRPYSLDYSSIPDAAPPIRGPERVFPKTNFTGWAKYVLDDSQQQNPITGQYERTRYTIFPPPQPKLITE